MDSDSYGTPADIIALVRAVLGAIDVDPASNTQAQKRIQASRFHTKSQNGLAHEWSGRVFLNPPYSKPAPFVAKLCADFRIGTVTAAILLVNSSTETRWYQEACRTATGLCLPDHRLAFHHPVTDGICEDNRYAQTFFYFGDRFDLFEREFSELGAVFKRNTSGSVIESLVREISRAPRRRHITEASL